MPGSTKGQLKGACLLLWPGSAGQPPVPLQLSYVEAGTEYLYPADADPAGDSLLLPLSNPPLLCVH